MNTLSYPERIAIMRILLDIMLADHKLDRREKDLFAQIAQFLELEDTALADVEHQNSLLALTIIHDFTQSQKEELAKLMGKMITIDEDINYNEVKIYNVVNEFCHIQVEFNVNDYPQYTRS